MEPKLSTEQDSSSSSSSKSSNSGDFLANKPYSPPSWASHLFSLAQLPAPIQKWNLPNLPSNVEVWLKREDLAAGMEFGREQGEEIVILVGRRRGTRRRLCNHNRVHPKQPLLCNCCCCQALVDQDPGLTGNLLFNRVVGAHIELLSTEDLLEFGNETLTNILKEKLIKEGRRPYVIPVGGTNSLGTWGYIEAIREIERQIQNAPNNIKFDDIVVACGSGGTAAGLSLGSSLSSLKAKVHAFSIYEDPDYLYDFIQGLLDGLEAGVNSRDIVEVHNAEGLGYGINTSEELNLLKEISVATGVILHPSYIGKAVYGMVRDMSENPKKWEGRKILFIHTGGLLGLFGKIDELSSFIW